MLDGGRTRKDRQAEWGTPMWERPAHRWQQNGDVAEVMDVRGRELGTDLTSGARVFSMDMKRLRATGHRAAGAYKAAGVLMLNAVVCWLCLEIAGMVFLKLAPDFAGPPAGGEEIDARSRSPVLPFTELGPAVLARIPVKPQTTI